MVCYYVTTQLICLFGIWAFGGHVLEYSEAQSQCVTTIKTDALLQTLSDVLILQINLVKK